jgi:hypothetical protein
MATAGRATSGTFLAVDHAHSPKSQLSYFTFKLGGFTAINSPTHAVSILANSVFYDLVIIERAVAECYVSV